MLWYMYIGQYLTRNWNVLSMKVTVALPGSLQGWSLSARGWADLSSGMEVLHLQDCERIYTAKGAQLWWVLRNCSSRLNYMYMYMYVQFALHCTKLYIHVQSVATVDFLSLCLYANVFELTRVDTCGLCVCMPMCWINKGRHLWSLCLYAKGRHLCWNHVWTMICTCTCACML